MVRGILARAGWLCAKAWSIWHRVEDSRRRLNLKRPRLARPNRAGRARYGILATTVVRYKYC